MSLALVLAAVAACFTLSLQAEDKETKFEPKCPVSGKAAIKDHAVAYKGAEVYFCCPNCPKAFEKDPTKFAAKANHQLVGTKQAVQKKCPLAGRPLNEATAIDVQGVKVAFCCNNCKGKAEGAEGAEQINLIFSDANFAKGFEVKKKDGASEAQ